MRVSLESGPPNGRPLFLGYAHTSFLPMGFGTGLRLEQRALELLLHLEADLPSLCGCPFLGTLPELLFFGGCLCFMLLFLWFPLFYVVVCFCSVLSDDFPVLKANPNKIPERTPTCPLGGGSFSLRDWFPTTYLPSSKFAKLQEDEDFALSPALSIQITANQDGTYGGYVCWLSC